MIQWLLGLFRKAEPPPCHHCGSAVQITTRLMGDVVPYEWIECTGCPAKGWGARL